jgi:hypothetical protein
MSKINAAVGIAKCPNAKKIYGYEHSEVPDGLLIGKDIVAKNLTGSETCG